jgi:hypothetical protein
MIGTAFFNVGTAGAQWYSGQAWLHQMSDGITRIIDGEWIDQ